MNIKYLAIFLSSIIFLLIIELIRKEKLTFKYAAGWLFVSLLSIVFSIFDQLLFSLADFFGFELASNFIFFVLLAVFVFLSLLMTIFLCQQNNRNDSVAQKIGVLEYEIEKLKKEDKGNS